MNKKIFTILIIGLILITGCSPKEKSDSIKFKKEYESLNGQTNSSQKIHRTLSIPTDNPFIYVTAEEIIQKIENKETFYVYFGSAYCPWCRSVIEKFIEVANKNKIKKVYYVDIWDGDHVEILRDQYQLNDEGQPNLIKEGGPGYKELLEYLNPVLPDYTLTDENGNTIPVGEKRIFAPNFISIEKGQATRLVEGISNKQKDSRAKLTKEILKEEETNFNDFFNPVSKTCQTENC